ncbi:MAG TPA: hypothetical protein VF320_06785 [Acidimicrobiales bacterium]
MASDDPELGEPTFVRTGDARRELVFACMTTTEHLTHFWGAVGGGGGRRGLVTHLATV